MSLVKSPTTISRIIAPIILCIAAIAVFYDILPIITSRVISSPFTDIANQFLSWRDYGFSELKRGHLALWNPYLFSGAPFFGGFQSALLYPLNFPYLILPLTLAINTGLLLHVFLLGLFMYVWLHGRGLSPWTALFAGILVMFSGTHFPHIYAGHLPNLCAMAWVPLIFWAMDGLLHRPSAGRFLIGSFAFAMHILAGHPQYVYYTAIAIAIYTFLHILWAPAVPDTNIPRWKGPLAILSVITGGLALSAIQILPGWEAMRESLRAGHVPASFAAMFSFPPENLLTFITPFLFGSLNEGIFYWGRTYLWEANAFVGVSTLALAGYGLLKGDRHARLAAVMVIIMILLALGAHTPLFGILYAYLPGFGSFRGTAKFMFYAVLFVIFLAALGWERLGSSITGATEKKDASPGAKSFFGEPYGLIILFLALLTAGCGTLLQAISDGNMPPGLWKGLLQTIGTSGESYAGSIFFRDEEFVRHAAMLGARQFFIAAAVFLSTALLWRMSHRGARFAVYGIALLAIIEVFSFSRMCVTSFNPTHLIPPALKQFVAHIDPEARILNLWRPNASLGLRVCDLWGNDPGIPRRYAELIAATQGQDPHAATQYIPFHQYHPLFRMLRLSYIITPGERGLRVLELPRGMSRLHLVENWQVEPVPGKILTAMTAKDFDPEKTVILEQLPPITPNHGAGENRARLVSSLPDSLIIEAHLASPQVLLLTDNYARGWRAQSLNDSQHCRYELVRANYTLMALPLTAGDHKIRVFYRPSSLWWGLAISILALLTHLFVLWSAVRRPRQN